jgi:hypothetical protein
MKRFAALPGDENVQLLAQCQVPNSGIDFCALDNADFTSFRQHALAGAKMKRKSLSDYTALARVGRRAGRRIGWRLSIAKVIVLPRVILSGTDGAFFSLPPMGPWSDGECIAVDLKTGELEAGQDHRHDFGKAAGY